MERDVHVVSGHQARIQNKPFAALTSCSDKKDSLSVNISLYKIDISAKCSRPTSAHVWVVGVWCSSLGASLCGGYSNEKQNVSGRL